MAFSRNNTYSRKTINKGAVIFSMLLLFAFLSITYSFGQTTETFVSSTSWTVPDGVTSITVECWGAGGAGSTGNGGGGGGGSYARSVLTDVSGSYSVIVGTGGTPGTDGGASSFGGGTVNAPGGLSATGTAGANGGTGGTGDVTYNGGNGAAGSTAQGGNGGGGGGGAGSTGAGGNANGTTGGTGTANNGGAGGEGSKTGGPGLVYGGAGGGNKTNAPGNGANGYVTITYTAVASPPTITLGANPSVLEGTTTANLPYSATTNSPDQYSINYDATAEGQGFVDVSLASLPASPIVLSVPGAAAPATYNGILTVTNSSSGLTSGDYPITVTITPGTPTITLTDPNPSVVQGVTSANMDYTATTYNPDQYSIDYDATAEGQGFADVLLAALPASPIVLVVPGSAALDTYNGVLTVKNSGTGVVSGNYPITITVTAAPVPPTITLGAFPSVLEGTTSANLPYTATTDNPDQYSINYDATAEGQGFVDVTLASLPASPIVLAVPGAAAPATYNGILTVTNSSSGLTSGDYPITVTITPGTPTITITDPNPSVVQGVTTANVPYSATTYSPDQYSIDYDANAEAQGFIDVSLAALPASPIVLVVPGAAAVNTYNAILTVKNSSTGVVSSNYAIAVTITSAPVAPTITLGTFPSVVEGAVSANLPYTATTSSPDQYSINYDATAEGQGFVDVTLAALPASPIVLVVPGAASPAIYNGILTVRNSGTGLTSGDYAITVTITPGIPTITITDPNPSVVQGITSANIAYTATSYSPDQYSIDYDATAEGQGFADVTLAVLPASPIVLVVPGAAAVNTYNGILTVKNSGTGAVSGNYAITVTVTASASPPTITLTNANPSVVEGTTSANITYSATTDNPDQYSVNYDAAAEGQGFVDVNLAALPASPIVLVVPGAAAAGTYNGILTVKNSTTGLTSGNYAITVTLTTAALPPTITLGTDPTVCQGTTSADLSYIASTGSPDQYSINYFVAAEAAGFSDVVNASLTASPITLTVPAAAAAGTYYANLTVRNSGTGLSSTFYPISVTVITAPSTPAFIFGSTAVPELTAGIKYSIVGIPGATSYTWTWPSGWTLTGGNGTTSITLTSGTAGQNGNITVYANSPCGPSGTAILAVTSEVPADHTLYGCNACHITHNAPGGALTTTFGNANLCMSCHVSSAAASEKPFVNADKAIPGTSGTSHAWDVPSVNTTYETVLTGDPQMVLRVDADNNDNITCSTCHDQHNSNANLSYTRVSNVGDAMCKDCHSPRNLGRYIDNTASNIGSHPVGLTYTPGGQFKDPAPAASATAAGIVAGKVECSSCHMVHYANTSDGNLLRQASGNDLCKSCHTLMDAGGTPAGTHNGMSCLDCHQTHNADPNIYMIKSTITTPASGDKAVVFTALTGTNNFADGDGLDGVCEVCHTATDHFRNSDAPAAPDQLHTSQGAGISNTNCTGCHPHSSNFSPSGGGCTGCHDGTPTFNSAVHIKHKDTYGYACNTCHFGHGSGGGSEPTHPSGTKNIVFDPNGMATRNGLDPNTPSWNGSTCSNVYCHSTGTTANRFSEGVAVWNSSASTTAITYATTPEWGVGTITACVSCHEGPATMPAGPDYTIVEANTQGVVTLTSQYPNTGAHGSNTGAHNSPDQLIVLTEDGTYGDALSHSWPKVQCFWCHNNDAGAASGEPKYQGTYGTSRHVDGKTWFYPSWYGFAGIGEKTSGGQAPAYYLMDTEAEINALGNGYVWHPNPTNPDFGPSMIPGLGYAWMGPTNEHCGNGKNCW